MLATTKDWLDRDAEAVVVPDDPLSLSQVRYRLSCLHQTLEVGATIAGRKSYLRCSQSLDFS